MRPRRTTPDAPSTDDSRCTLDERLPTRPRRTIPDALSTSDFRHALDGRFLTRPRRTISDALATSDLRCALDGRLLAVRFAMRPRWTASFPTCSRRATFPICSQRAAFPICSRRAALRCRSERNSEPARGRAHNLSLMYLTRALDSAAGSKLNILST